MTVPGENCDIRSFDKSAHLLACPPAKMAFWTELGQTSTARLIFKRSSLIDNGLNSCIFVAVDILLITGRTVLMFEITKINGFAVATLTRNKYPPDADQHAEWCGVGSK
jgi:hypothetical protein